MEFGSRHEASSEGESVSGSCATGPRRRRPRLYAKSFDADDWMGLTSSDSSDQLEVDRRMSTPCLRDRGSARRVRFEMPEFHPELYRRTAAVGVGNECETAARTVDTCLGYESETEHIDIDEERCMLEDTDSEASESAPRISSRCCDRCSRSYLGFGSICPACRKLPQRGSASSCSACGAFFTGFGDTCDDCRFPSANRPRSQTEGFEDSCPRGYLGAGNLRGRAASQS